MKTAIITGTSSGLGEGFARALLDLGWKVYGISRHENIELVAHENFRQICMDLSQALDKKLLRESIGEKKIDLLANNAGINLLESQEEWDEKSMRQMFAVNYETPMQLALYLRGKLRDGMVINTLSLLTHFAWRGYEFGTYGASKAALWSHIRNYSIQNPEITVYNLHPNAIDTPLIDTLGEEIASERSEFMKTKEVTTVFTQLVAGLMALPTGASIFLYNEWQKEDTVDLGKDLYLYNVETESLKKI